MKFNLLGILGLALLAANLQAQSVSTLSSGFSEPHYVTTDNNGVVYVTDGGTANRIMKYDPQTSLLSSLAGLAGTTGTNNGTGVHARFSDPQGIVYVPARGGLVVADAGNQLLRFVSLSGVVSNLAGIADSNGGGYADGPALSAQFSLPIGLAADTNGNVYIADSGNGLIRKLDTNGNVSTIISASTTPAVFNQPNAVAVGDNGDLWVADTLDNLICRIDGSGNVTTIAGGGASYDGHFATDGSLNHPRGLCWVSSTKLPGLYIADTANNAIRRVYYNPEVEDYSLETIAGDPSKAISADGSFATASFDGPKGLAFESDTEGVLVVDQAGQALRLMLASPLQAPLDAPTIGTVSFVFDSNQNYVTQLTPVIANTFYNDVTLAVLPPSGSELTTCSISRGSITKTNVAPSYANGILQSVYNQKSLLDFTSGNWITITAQSSASGRRPSTNISALVRFKVQTPLITGDNPGGFTLDDETAGTLFYYTTDGSEPTDTNPNATSMALSSGGTQVILSISSDVLFKVRGYRDNYMESDVASQEFSPTNFSANKITFGFKDGEASSDFIACAGQRFYAPVTLTLLPGQKIYSLQFNLVVTNSVPEPINSYSARFTSMLEKPVPGTTPPIFTNLAPELVTNTWIMAVTTNNGVITTNLAPVYGEGNMMFTNYSENLIGVSWLERYGKTNLYDTTKQDLITYSRAHDNQFLSANGSVILGAYSFVVPLDAPADQTYRISIGLPSGTADGINTPVSIYAPTNGSLTTGGINSIKNVSLGIRNYLVGDVTPFHWLNAGDFGKTNLAGVDVEQVFQSAIYRWNTPPQGSDFYDAMDSCGTTTDDMLDGNDFSINSMLKGDGYLDVNDVYVTYRRSVDPGLNWVVRYWSNGVFYANSIPNPNAQQVLPVKQAIFKPAAVPTPHIPRSLKVVAADKQINGGGTVQIPVIAQLIGNLPVRVLMQSISVVPLDGSPEVTAAVQFTPDPALGNPEDTYSQDPATFGGVWLSSTVPGVYGTNSLGTLTITLPDTVSSKSAYLVHFNHFSASPNGFALFPAQEQDGLITVGDRSASSWSDGISDSWRLRNFGTISNLLSSADADADGDGLSNLQEFNEGTSPNDPSSPLRAINPQKTAHAAFLLKWFGATNKLYTIECSSALFGTNWTTIATNLSGDGGLKQFVDTNATGTAKFYRVRLVQ